MVSEQNDRIDLIPRNINERSSDELTLKNVIDSGSSLILALEDMIGLLGSTYKYGSGLSQLNGKNVSIKDYKDKIGNTRELFNVFSCALKKINPVVLKQIGLDVNDFLRFGEHVVDEILMEWSIRADVDKVIDYTHDLCYKIRGIIRKTENI